MYDFFQQCLSGTSQVFLLKSSRKYLHAFGHLPGWGPMDGSWNAFTSFLFTIQVGSLPQLVCHQFLTKETTTYCLSFFSSGLVFAFQLKSISKDIGFYWSF